MMPTRTRPDTTIALAALGAGGTAAVLAGDADAAGGNGGFSYLLPSTPRIKTKDIQ